MTAAPKIPSKETIDALMPVLTWLEAGAPHDHRKIGFSMEVFIEEDSNDYANNECGTACCIAGAVRQFNGFRTRRTGNLWEQIRYVGNKIGMTEDQSRRLFFAAGSMIEVDDVGPWPDAGALLPGDQGIDNISPRQAAKALRGFIDTGVIEWSAP